MTAVELVRGTAHRGDAAVNAVGKLMSRRTTWKWIASSAFVALFIVEIVLLTPILSRAADALSQPDLRWLALGIFAEMASMGAFARVQRRMLSAGGAKVSVCRMAALTYAANAMSATFPGGAALSSGYVFRRLRSWGATGPAASFTIIASGILSTVSFALLAATCAVVAGNGGLSSLLVMAAVLILVATGVWTARHHSPDLLTRSATAALSRVNRLLHRAPESGLATVDRIAREFTAIKPRSRDWLAGLGFAGLNWVGDLTCLVACCRAVDASGSTLVLMTVAYLAGMSASGVSLLPGGIGTIDAAMIFALTQGGVNAMSATAAVLLYRLISFAAVVALGWIVWAATWYAERQSSYAEHQSNTVQREPAQARQWMRTAQSIRAPQSTSAE